MSVLRWLGVSAGPLIDGRDALLGDSTWFAIIKSINHTSCLINYNHIAVCFNRSKERHGRVENEKDTSWQKNREPSGTKSEYSIETILCGIVMERNCYGPYKPFIL